MKVFHVLWNVPETVFHEMLWKKSFTVYPCLKIIMNCSFSNQNIFTIITILLGIGRKQISFSVPIFRNILYLIVTIIITERFNIHSSRIMQLAATWSFLLGCAPKFINASLFYCWHWLKSLPTGTLFHNSQNISKLLTLREQRRLIPTRFDLKNILSSLGLETVTVNNNLIINSMSLQS